MDSENDVHITERPPAGCRGTLMISDTVLGISDSAAIVLRSLTGYDEGIKVETEFLLRRPGIHDRPLRGATDPQKADPAVSFGAGAEGDFRSITWNVDGEALNIWTIGADETHSRLTVRTWIEPPPEELVIGVRWLTHGIEPAHLRTDCRHPGHSWSVPLWP